MLFLVIAFDRPRYLDVTLETIYRVRGIERHSVMVTVDGGGKHREEVLEVLKRYPLNGWLMHNHNLSILKHITHSIANMMAWGYDEVMYLEEDLIVRPDVLDYLETAPRDAFFISLSKSGPPSPRELRRLYRPLGNLVRSDCFFQLVDYVKSGAYIGTNVGALESAFTGNCFSHHAVFSAFTKCYDKLSRIPPIQYVQHFGVTGANFGYRPGGDRIEKRMFAGPRRSWLTNILKVAKSSDHVAFQPNTKFDYGEEV